jgi:SAM-dependent methyltransferase
MAQNIYDDSTFFDGYSRLPRSQRGLDGAPEWPEIRALLPDMAGRRVVDLGCGFGWFARWARSEGAAAVLGLDLSDNMLARARAETADPAIRYEKADLDTLMLPEAAFDFAYSSLAFHYVTDFPRLVNTVHAALVPGAHFVFSIEHPVLMASHRAAWQKHADGSPLWPVDHYADEGERRTDWLAPGVVKQHRTLATTANTLIEAGFRLRRLVEWAPSPALLRDRPDLQAERHRPMFLIVAAQR